MPLCRLTDHTSRTLTQCHALIMAILLLPAFGACERQGPPPKPIGAATNKHVEETSAAPSRLDADAMTQNIKTPMEKARQTEDRLRESADRQQVEHTSP